MPGLVGKGFTQPAVCVVAMLRTVASLRLEALLASTYLVVVAEEGHVPTEAQQGKGQHWQQLSGVAC